MRDFSHARCPKGLLRLSFVIWSLLDQFSYHEVRGVATAFSPPHAFQSPSPLSHGIRYEGPGAKTALEKWARARKCPSTCMSFGQGPTNLMKSLAVWRASRRGPGRGTGRAEDVGIVDGTGGDHRALQAYADGSGPPRGPRRGRWGWGGGGDGGGDGDGHEKFWVGSNVAAVGAMQYFSFRRSRYGSYGGGGRRGYYGRQTYRRRDRRGEGNITMTQAVTALNMIVFLLQMRFPSITSAGWKLASAISQRGQWYRLLTPVVLHGSLMHLVINTMSLNSVGPVVEKVMGKAKFVVIYVLAGMSGNVLSCLVNPRMPAVGASGAIFGMVGAWGAFCIMNQSAMGAENAQRSLAAVGQTLAFNLFLGMSSSQIDNMGHLGGFLGGAIATFFIGPRLKSFACTEGGLEECNGGFRAKAALYRGFPIAVLLATGGLLAGEACAVKTASS